MKYLLWGLIFLVFFSSASIAQTDSVYYGKKPDATDSNKTKKLRNEEWKKKITYGGNFQLQFGSYTFVYLSPTIGYALFKKLNVGVGGIYNYVSFGKTAQYSKFSVSIFGAHSYVRYFINEGFFAQIQFDKLLQPDFYSPILNKKVWVDYFLVGGGFRQPLGNRAALTSLIMYNLTPSELSIYPNRLVIQFGFIGNF